MSALFCVACADADEPDSARGDRAVMAAQLDRLGLWRDLPSSVRAANIAAVEAGTHPWATELSGSVSFFADGEELAEGGVEMFFTTLRQPLLELGVEVVVSTVDDPSTGVYSVAIGDEVIPLYDDESRSSGVEHEHPWFAATMRPLAALNRRLAAAGAVERFVVLYPGENYGRALLIDPAIIELLVPTGLLDGDELPLEP